MHRSLFPPLYIVLTAIFIYSCDSFETKVPASEIKKASAWSKNDQFPSFPNCEGLKGENAQKCFGDIVGENIATFLSTQEMVASRSIDAEIILVIEVDKEGALSLAAVEDPNYVLSDVSNLKDMLEQAVAQAPKALPATKTNVGTYVTVSVKLPVQIVAQPATE
ncbi:MAG: hypothetical protein ACON47_08660 [Flavobacteriaceae bacterium]